jgi:hypothetical protein
LINPATSLAIFVNIKIWNY